MINESIRVHDRYYILATSARIDSRTRVLKHGDTFGVFDRFGDLDDIARNEFGIYHRDTRFLSRLVMRLEGQRPLLLDSTTREENSLFTVDFMNPDLQSASGAFIPRGQLHIFRSKVLWNDGVYEHLRIRNYGQHAVAVNVSLEFGADFVDLFEVRGIPRLHRGSIRSPRLENDALVFEYEGLDGEVRRTRIVTDPPPVWRSHSEAEFHCELGSHGEVSIEWSIRCESESKSSKSDGMRRYSYSSACENLAISVDASRSLDPAITSSNERFDSWIRRSFSDIRLLRTETPYGSYPYAGVPWYSTVFGRDGIITALQCLWLNPTLARDVLRYLAATQATEHDLERDAQPGKILHETRAGEMAALREIPFGRYYGSIDATPLFVVLAGAYVDWTGDLDSAKTLWPHIELALGWIEQYGDSDGDGFYEYSRLSHDGLVNQGWKDSQDSVFHADGTLAEGPIALCEVQGYVFAAKHAAARIALLLNQEDRARQLVAQATELQTRFESAFWCEELSTYALALDGEKARCRVVTSNSGHCLFAGIAGPDHAGRTAATLMGGGCYTGWGVRTASLAERRYNPMSYHNGSVWPHDNAMIAAGLARYGMKNLSAKIMSGLFDAASHSDLHRLPELFCGFTRRPHEAPTLYPVACSPQAWAAGAVFMCLQACLGLEWRQLDRTLTFRNPTLPLSLTSLRIRNLRLGDAIVEVLVRQDGTNVEVEVHGETDNINIVSMD